MNQITNLQLREWIGLHKDELISLRKWPDINKRILSEFSTSLTHKEVYDLLFPEKVIHCENARYISFSVGYRTCKKGCECYTTRVSNSVKKAKQNITPEQKQLSFQKRRNTVLNKYGVENVFQLSEVVNKSCATKIGKYNNPHFTNSDKRKETVLTRYGVSNVMQLDAVKQKNQEGRDNVLAAKKVADTKYARYQDSGYNNKHKRIATNLARYGVNNPAQSSEVKEKIKESLKSKSKFILQSDFKIAPEILLKKNSSICNTNEVHEVKDFLRSLGITLQENVRNIISPKELDIYVPDHNIAIEYCGLYWHRESAGKDKNYHLNKFLECQQKGIRLITLFSDSWVNKKEITKSRLMQLFKKQPVTIGARKCSVQQLSHYDTTVFLNNNHHQGSAVSKVAYGLCYQSDLLAVMTFGKSRFEKDTDELIRFSVKSGVSVPGAASKLLTHYLTHHSPERLISYSDNQWGSSNLYSVLNFRKVSNGMPGYSYIDVTGNYNGRLNRLAYQKHKLLKLFPDVDPNLTEYQIMLSKGYDRVWDCGHSKWELVN